ncbi:MAG: tRNA(Ile)-lysidine synthetase, partial [Gammaproteobacteria bacterium]|nr:tRNA(Ile)-lysidine synthetase [Gammaproteobacteria bacterium]
MLSITQHLPERVNRFIIAYSGGMDSHVLLHAMASLRELSPDKVLHAVHIDHDLQAKSGEWSEHCQTVCKQLNISCDVIKVNARAEAGESPEAAARDARYRALLEVVEEGDCL